MSYTVTSSSYSCSEVVKPNNAIIHKLETSLRDVCATSKHRFNSVYCSVGRANVYQRTGRRANVLLTAV